jgi:tetratricopeptide (TPR) repeat protein
MKPCAFDIYVKLKSCAGVFLAANKDKLLESAQKNLKKKQIAKAIKDYVKVVEIDGADMRSRQKLAELYVRCHKLDEAYEQYEALAKYFSSNGFYLKAIAIYKLMQRLDPSQVGLYNRLAELYEKQGQLGNAMAEYRSLADYYARNGMVADEIRTLEKMSGLDENNLNIRVKLAETYARNERLDDGLDLFEKILDALSNKGDFEKILHLYKMFMPLYPENSKLQKGLALALYAKGDYARGVKLLDKLRADNPKEPDLLRLIGRGRAASGHHAAAQNAFEQLLEMDPTDLDVRESLFRSQLAQELYTELLDGLEEWKETFGRADRIDSLKFFYETLKGKLPKDNRVIQTLDSIYSLTGEGDKILDIISERQDVSETPVIEETLSDSLLESVDREADAVEDELFDLQLESSDPDVGSPAEDATGELSLGDDLDLFGSLDTSDEMDFDFNLSDSVVEMAAPEEHQDLQGDLEEAEFYLQQGLHDDARTLYKKILGYAPDNEECKRKLEECDGLVSTAQASAGSVAEFESGEIPADAFADFDFAASIEVEVGTGNKKVFKTDVDEQIASDDMESHYNLGIAYREMGLYNDAISEFDKALKDPTRYADCMTLKGLCYTDQDDFDNAEMMFQQALDSTNLDEIQRLNLGYELGLFYERVERQEEALTSYRTVLKQDANYRDVSDKVIALSRELGVEDEDVVSNAGTERISFL